MTVKFTNNASTTVATGINTTATSLVVASAAGFPTLSGSGDYCYLTIQQASGNVLEVVKATALSSNTFTIVRAQDGTSAGSWSTGDAVELRITAALLTDIAEQADETVSLAGAGATSVSGTYPNFTVTSTDTNTTYSAGSGISLSGTTFSNSAPDQTVSLTGAGATSISGTYPNFTITGTDTNTTYSVGDGGLTQNNFTNALKSKLDGIEASANVTDTANVVGALTAGSNVTIASDGTISATDTNTNTTYSAGSGITLSGTTFSNSAPDQTVALTGSGGTTVSGSYPNFTISSAASIDGTTINPSNIKISGAQGTDGQVLTSTGSGVAWEDSHNNSFTVNTFTANGSTTAFTLSTSPSSENNLMVFIEGVYQNPSDFTLSGTTLTLDAAPPNGRKIIVYQVTSVVRGNALNHDQFSCNGSTTAFTLGVDPLSENNTQVFLDGVYQQKTDYAVSGTTLTMDTAPASGATLEVMTFLDTAQAVVNDGSITTAKLADDSVTVDKIQDQGTDGKVLTSTGSGVAWETPAGGGAWTHISTTNVTSAVATIEITISGSYDYYVLRYSGWNTGTNSAYPTFGITTVGGSYSETIKYLRNGYGGDTSAGSNTHASTGASYASVWPVARVASANGSAFGELHISNVAGMPSIHGVAHVIDDDQSLDLGLTTFVIGFDSPSSNDKIGKVKVRADSASNAEAGKFVLYGIATS